MSNPDLQHFELHDLRRFADKAPFDIQQKFHALLNAYEASEEHGAATENYEDQLKVARDALATLEGLLPKAKPAPPMKRLDRGGGKAPPMKRLDRGGGKAPPPPPPPERLSDDAWAERLEDLPNNAERQAAIVAELERARAGEAAALARIEALEEGIESAVEDLGKIDEPAEVPAEVPAHEARSSELFHCACCQRASPNSRTRI